MTLQEALSLFGLTGVDDIDQSKIRKTYRGLIKKYHPDVTEGYEDVVAQLNEAMRLLKNFENIRESNDSKKTRVISVDELSRIINEQGVESFSDIIVYLSLELRDESRIQNVMTFGIPKKRIFEGDVAIEMIVEVEWDKLGRRIEIDVRGNKRSIELDRGIVIMPIRLCENIVVTLQIYRVKGEK